MSNQNRTIYGGKVNREKPINFVFNGKSYIGYQGDTLASALLANDVHLIGRSFKYHRARGILTAGSEEPNAIVQLGLGARTEPNIRATEIVVLDDALASVDNKTAARIIDEMRERSNKTILMISHQLSVAATCDRVLVMDKGEIVQEGNHKDLIKEEGLYKKLWEREIATNIVKG